MTMTTRRLFLKSSGLAMFGVGAAPLWLAWYLWVTRGGKAEDESVALIPAAIRQS